MKKPKISLDSAKMKTFLLNHVEKIVLIGFVGVMLFIIWQGFSLPALDANKKPTALISQSDSAMQFIDNPERWNTELRDVRMIPMNVVERTKEATMDAEPQAYALAMQWNKPDFPKLSPRTDPTLFAPQSLVAIATVGPLAVFAKPGELDPLEPVPTDDAPVKKKPIKKKVQVYDDGYGTGMPGEGMPQKRGKKGGKAAGNLAGEGSMPGGYGGEYGGGYGAMGTGMPGQPFPEAMVGNGFLPQAVEQTIAKNVHAVTILATVPFQKQMEEYERTLGNSLDYDPNRDFPYYIAFYVQRADVTADPSAEADKLDWKSIGVQRALREAMGSQGSLGDPNTKPPTPAVPPTPPVWAGYPTDVADPNYLDPGVLTHPAPPFMARDLWPLLVHPDVPLLSMANQYGMVPGATAATDAAGAAAAQNEDAPPKPGFMPPGMAGGMGGGMPGMTGSPDGGGRGMPGMGGGYGGGGGYGNTAGGYGSAGGGGYGGGYSGEGGYGSAGMYGSSDGGYGAATAYVPPKYKMIRFTDTSVQPGHKYRYRLQVVLNDPNHPGYMMPSPSSASLHEDVRKRIKPLDDADMQAAKAAGQTLLPGQAPQRNVYYVESPWSEPTDVVELPWPGRVFASKVTPARRGGEPRADALAVAWDPTKVADVAVEQKDKVFRGSLLNFKMKDIKVIHPVDKRVVTLPEEYSVYTNLLVADMMGGERLPQIDSTINPEPLTAPGELLIFDPQGNMRVQNEADDIEGFRRFTVQKEDPKAAAAATAASDGGDLGTPDGRTRRQPVRRGTGCN